MPIKIKNLTISGVRGIQTSINIPLNEQSMLIYGENGSGKSSIVDAIEWLYKDDVSHLSNAEINLNEALRNSRLDKTTNSEISITYNQNLTISRKLFYQKNKLISELCNFSQNQEQYIVTSEKENLLIRYYLLRDFVSKTKSEKLETLSDIIGLSEVTKVRGILKKAFNSVKNEIKSQNFENQIDIQKETLISKIGVSISQEKNLIEKINEVIKPLNLDIVAGTIKDIDGILRKLLNQSVNKELLSLQTFLENTKDIIVSMNKDGSLINEAYNVFYTEFNKIAADTQSIMQAYLAELLKAGNLVIEKKYHKDNTCPLCLQQKDLVKLNEEITQRLQEIRASTQIKVAFDNAKKLVATISLGRIKRIDSMLDNPIMLKPDNNDIKQALESLKTKFKNYYETIEKKVIAGDKLPDNNQLCITDNDFKIHVKILERLGDINITIKNNKATEIYSNISASREAFLKIKRLENEKSKLEIQKKSLELIYNEITKQQREVLESFINNFSTTINEFYQYMNPCELFQEIRIVPMGEEDGLKGITIEYKYNDVCVSPPQKYFSDGHLNCFGIAFFLASVIAFNKENKFIVLDDAISSFDTEHRKRFADLLFEKFAAYQIILLTHETEWFNYVSPLAKKKNWLVDTVKWSETKGTYLEEKTPDLKEFIEESLESGTVETLGNAMRQYLERILKDICSNLEVQVKFRFNDINEKRMSDELLNSLKSRIKDKGKNAWIEQLKIIDSVADSSILANLLSHDNPFNPKSGDLKAFWRAIQKLEKIFICQEECCRKPKISVKNYDNVNNKIRCGCGKTLYDWEN
jgi:energy-coupling factor transporter ATP-binding protein EcfA2